MKTTHPQMRELPLGTLPWNLVDAAGAIWRWEGRRLTLLVEETTIAVVDLEQKVLRIDVQPQSIQAYKSAKQG